MKATLFILIFVLSVTATAKSKTKPKSEPKSPTVKEEAPYREPVPGGVRADQEFWKKWEGSIRHQGFKILPHSDELKKDKDQVHSDQRPRYILHMDTSKVDMKNEIWDEGYYHYAYSTKEQGDFLLQVHPRYRECFDDLTKKFSEMQWVVFGHGEIVGRKVLRLETPRQCMGQLKETGSKLPTASGALEN